jgi:hypothetical protein
MADPVETFAIDNSQWYQVKVGTAAKEVLVLEDAGAATISIKFRRPAGSASSASKGPGVPVEFKPNGGRRYFMPNEVVGEVQAVSGSATVQRVEN